MDNSAFFARIFPDIAGWWVAWYPNVLRVLAHTDRWQLPSVLRFERSRNSRRAASAIALDHVHIFRRHLALRWSLTLIACFVTMIDPNIGFAAEPGVSDNAIRIGMVNAQTGDVAGLGRRLRTGAEAVFDDANAHGGVYGRKIELVVADDHYEPDGTVDSTLEMIGRRDVFALFGYVGTPTTTAVLPIVRETGIPLVGPLTGAMGLRKPVIPEVFNIRASYEDETRALVDRFIEHDGARRFAVFYQNDSSGLAVLAGARLALLRHGLDVVATGTFRRGTTAIDTGLASILDSRPDVVIMVGPYTPIAAFIHAAHREGLKARLAAVSFVGSDDLAHLVGDEGDGMLISQVVPLPEDDRAVIRDCTRLIERHSPGEHVGVVNMEGCIDAKIMLIGLERAGPSPSRATLKQALESIRNFDLGGLMADLGSDNHQALHAVFLTEIMHGQAAPLYAPAK